MNKKNRQVIEEFRANGGIVSVRPPNGPILLLHTTGAKTGKPCLTPLIYLECDGAYLVAASMGGWRRNPDWYYNLVAQPNARIEVGREVLEVHAEIAQGAERDRLYAELSSAYPQFAYYQGKTSRAIPVILLRSSRRAEVTLDLR